jgi:rhamnogalacturonan hydrolase
MFMFKSYGGSGSVYDITLQNFIGHKNAYSLYLNGYWTSQTEAPETVFYIMTLHSAIGG